MVSYSGGSRSCEKGGPGIQIPRFCARKSAKIGKNNNKHLPKKGGGGPRPIRPPPGSATVLCRAHNKHYS